MISRSSLLSILFLIASSLQVPEWRNIRVHADVSRLEKLSESNNGPVLYNGFVFTLIPAMLKHLEDTIQVKSELKMTLTNQKCDDVSDIGPYFNAEIEADLVLFFTISDANDGTIASAIDCMKDAKNKRPIAGLVNVNVASMNDVSEPFRSAHIATYIHEVYHILGFTTDYFDKFIDSNDALIPKSSVVKAITSGKFKEMIITPKVVAWAKTHFGCSTLEGVPLEEQGGEGTASNHWDKFIAASELMGPIDYPEATVTGLSLSYLEDTGLYKVKYSMEETWEWGKGAGCAFITGDCNAHPQKCDKTATPTLCSHEFAYKGTCSVQTHNTDCPFFEGEPTGDCRFSQNTIKGDYVTLMTFSPEGRCVQSLLGTTAGKQPKETQNCLKMTCVSNVVKIKVGEDEVTCSAAGKKDINAAVGSYVVCPDPTKFCARESERCPEDCNGNGRCLKDKTCWCYPGFAGNSCKDAGPKYTYKTLLTIKEAIEQFGRITSFAVSLALGFAFLVVI